jgi:CMP-N-acetylneuraminic acid synthetase
MYHKDTALYARKMDWLLLHRRDELRKIMHDNGNFFLFKKRNMFY